MLTSVASLEMAVGMMVVGSAVFVRVTTEPPESVATGCASEVEMTDVGTTVVVATLVAEQSTWEFRALRQISTAPMPETETPAETPTPGVVPPPMTPPPLANDPPEVVSAVVPGAVVGTGVVTADAAGTVVRVATVPPESVATVAVPLIVIAVAATCVVSTAEDDPQST